VGLHLSQIAEADELLTKDPLALLTGMVLDQRGSETSNALPVVARTVLGTVSGHTAARPDASTTVDR
jgi:hypothetical protein